MKAPKKPPPPPVAKMFAADREKAVKGVRAVARQAGKRAKNTSAYKQGKPKSWV